MVCEGGGRTFVFGSNRASLCGSVAAMVVPDADFAVIRFGAGVSGPVYVFAEAGVPAPPVARVRWAVWRGMGQNRQF